MTEISEDVGSRSLATTISSATNEWFRLQRRLFGWVPGVPDMGGEEPDLLLRFGRRVQSRYSINRDSLRSLSSLAAASPHWYREISGLLLSNPLTPLDAQLRILTRSEPGPIASWLRFEWHCRTPEDGPLTAEHADIIVAATARNSVGTRTERIAAVREIAWLVVRQLESDDAFVQVVSDWPPPLEDIIVVAPRCDIATALTTKASTALTRYHDPSALQAALVDFGFEGAFDSLTQAASGFAGSLEELLEAQLAQRSKPVQLEIGLAEAAVPAGSAVWV